MAVHIIYSGGGRGAQHAVGWGGGGSPDERHKTKYLNIYIERMNRVCVCVCVGEYFWYLKPRKTKLSLCAQSFE